MRALFIVILLDEGWSVKVTSLNIAERVVSSWFGSLGTFQDMWILGKDYEEFGAAIGDISVIRYG